MIRVKRVYDPPEKDDGERFLVERLWPRGVKKEALQMTAWLKEVAPSTELRKWFGHDPERWSEFQKRYRRELDALAKKDSGDSGSNPLDQLLEAARGGRLTLLFSARDTEHNSALVLREYLESHL